MAKSTLNGSNYDKDSLADDNKHFNAISGITFKLLILVIAYKEYSNLSELPQVRAYNNIILIVIMFLCVFCTVLQFLSLLANLILIARFFYYILW